MTDYMEKSYIISYIISKQCSPTETDCYLAAALCRGSQELLFETEVDV